jgi:hypothetical protein
MPPLVPITQTTEYLNSDLDDTVQQENRDQNEDTKEPRKNDEGEEKDDDEIYPDDSISRVMERAPLFSQSQAMTTQGSKDTLSVTESTTSRAHSRVSEFRRPSAVRRVHITDVEDEKM